jgi:hypothetical protein
MRRQPSPRKNTVANAEAFLERELVVQIDNVNRWRAERWINCCAR